MKPFVHTLITATVLAAASLTHAAETTLAITDDSEFNFTAHKKLLPSQSGTFMVFGGSVKITDDKVTSAQIEGDIDVSSMVTESGALAGVLKDKYFLTDKFEEIYFKSTTISPVEGKKDTYEVTGTMTIKEIEKEVKFPAKVTFADGTFELEGELKVDRNDWDLSYKWARDRVIKDMIDLEVYIAAEKE